MVLKEVTVWPGARVPVPVVWVYGCSLHSSGEAVVFHQEDLATYSERTVPGGFYLSEFWHLDTNSPRDVVEFCSKYGPGSSLSLIDHPLTMFDPWKGALARKAALQASILESLPDDAPTIRTLEEMRLFQGLMHGLVYLWFVASGQQDRQVVASLWRDDPQALAAWRPNPRFGERSVIDEWLSPTAADTMARGLNKWLRRFHVRVLVDDDDLAVEARADYFQVACLQFANDIADDADFKRCANETCEHFFTRHRGRAKQGKYHMTGVKYCSVECARAQKQREYRRRQRQKEAKP